MQSARGFVLSQRANGWRDEDPAWFAEAAVRPDVVGADYYPLHSTEVFEAGVFH